MMPNVARHLLGHVLFLGALPQQQRSQRCPARAAKAGDAGNPSKDIFKQVAYLASAATKMIQFANTTLAL